MCAPTERVLEALDREGWAFAEVKDEALVGALRRAAARLWRAGRFAPARIGRARTRAPSIRADWIAWVDEGMDPALDRYLAWLEELRASANARWWLGAWEVEAHFARYPPGGGYAMHWDNPQGREDRQLTVILYLNRGWRPGDGGALVLETARGRVRILPEAGRIVAFFSALFRHGVMRCARPRWSLAAWLRRRRELFASPRAF
ncbi:MAG: 2OG-Fe(II) oxygenase [Zetaproteobacteria bacterium]|nr:MAG: 2OG-Fe(II) oxygenase [Zetaproteobacteria bacterium]